MAQEQSGKKDTSERSVSELYPLQRRDISFIGLSFAVVALAAVLPTPAGLTHEGQVMLGILAMAVILWITTPIPIAVTALLVMIMQPLLDVMPAVDVFHSFGNEAVFFLIGAFVLAS
ncbi:MAG: anion permease, partial [Candidatus Thermoplasmatota archaeon]|nr:anion permease [Candidatus Thermoplasmatota archaeon]